MTTTTFPFDAPTLTNTTEDRAVKATALSELDLKFLAAVPVGGWTLRAVSPEAAKWWPVEEAATDEQRAAEWTGARLGGFSCVIAYEGEFGISLGVVRCRREGSSYPEPHFEVSPFPGGWETVPLSKIVSVRGTTEI